MNPCRLPTLPLAFALACLAADRPTLAGDEDPRSEFTIDRDAGRVIRRDADGKVRWSTPLEGRLGGSRPPHLLSDADRVYVTHGDGVTALEAGTGKTLWHSPGPAESMLLSGGLLLAAECESGDAIVARGRWLLARETRDGKEAFRVALPAKDFDPEPIREVAGLFLVQEMEIPGRKGRGLLIDRGGRVRLKLDRMLLGGHRQGDDLILLTSRDVARVAADGKTVWAVPFRIRQWPAGGGVVPLADGVVLAYLYGQISDSGVQVVRLEPGTGKQLWQSFCEPLGVTHSRYVHRAAVVTEEGRVKVTSRGSSGTFVELLDLGTGKLVKRTRP